MIQATRGSCVSHKRERNAKCPQYYDNLVELSALVPSNSAKIVLDTIHVEVSICFCLVSTTKIRKKMEIFCASVTR